MADSHKKRCSIQSLEKNKLKSQLDIIVHPLEWLRF